jgi:hypothetical protein
MSTEQECAICLDDINIKDMKILECNHKYHKECIDEWTKKKQICPYCRRYLKRFYEPKVLSFVFYNKCCIFISEEKESDIKITIVYKYPYTNKIRKIQEILIKQIKCVQNINNMVCLIYKTPSSKIKTLIFKFKKDESNIFTEKIKSLFNKNYIYMTNV